MPVLPGSGGVDDEPLLHPHSGTLIEEVGVTASVAGYVFTPAGNFQTLATYRSLVVVVNNRGAQTITVKPRYNFLDASGNTYSEPSQTVAALTRKRLIFQNEADGIVQIAFTTAAGTSLFDYYVAGSNLDPLPASSAADSILLRGVLMNIPAVVGGFSGEATWAAGTYQTVGAGIWTFTLDGAGNIVEVKSSTPGLYDMGADATFQAPSALTGESWLLNSFGTIPLAMQLSPIVTSYTADPWDAFVGLRCWFTSGAAQFSTQVNFDRNTTGVVIPDYWWITRTDLPS